MYFAGESCVVHVICLYMCHVYKSEANYSDFEMLKIGAIIPKVVYFQFRH